MKRIDPRHDLDLLEEEQYQLGKLMADVEAELDGQIDQIGRDTLEPEGIKAFLKDRVERQVANAVRMGELARDIASLKAQQTQNTPDHEPAASKRPSSAEIRSALAAHARNTARTVSSGRLSEAERDIEAEPD